MEFRHISCDHLSKVTGFNPRQGQGFCSSPLSHLLWIPRSLQTNGYRGLFPHR